MDKIEIAHQRYREGRFEEALDLYTAALGTATPTTHRIALYSNRAACYLRLHRFREAADECGAVLAIDCNHASVLMLRAQTLIALKDYRSALFDVTRLLAIGPRVPAYRELENRLRTQMTLATIPESEDEYAAESPPASPSSKSLRSFSPNTVLPLPDQQQQVKQGEQQNEVIMTKLKPIDYSKWDSIGDDQSDDEHEEEDGSTPQYMYRLRTVGLRAAGSS